MQRNAPKRYSMPSRRSSSSRRPYGGSGCGADHDWSGGDSLLEDEGLRGDDLLADGSREGHDARQQGRAGGGGNIGGEHRQPGQHRGLHGLELLHPPPIPPTGPPHAHHAALGPARLSKQPAESMQQQAAGSGQTPAGQARPCGGNARRAAGPCDERAIDGSARGKSARAVLAWSMKAPLPKVVR